MGELIADCTVGVHPQTVAAVIRVESYGDPLAIESVVLKKDRDRLPKIGAISRSKTISEAVLKAESLLNKGYSVSLGLMQINDFHFERFGVTVADLFNPCINIKIGTTILSENYAEASRLYSDESLKMSSMLSAYNTGRFKGNKQGLRYANRVISKVREIIYPDSVLSKLAVRYLQPRSRASSPVFVTHLGYNPVDPNSEHNPAGLQPVDYRSNYISSVLGASSRVEAFCRSECETFGNKGDNLNNVSGEL